jgi:hypothetical protein
LKVKSWLIVTLVLVLVMGAGTALALEPIKIMVNGQEVVGDTPAQIINNRTRVPSATKVLPLVITSSPTDNPLAIST